MLFPCSCHAWLSGWVQNAFSPDVCVFPHRVFPHLRVFPQFPAYSRLPPSFPHLSLFCPSSFPLLYLICSFSIIFASSLIFPSSVPHLSRFCPSSAHFPSHSRLPSSFPLLSLTCPFSIISASRLFLIFPPSVLHLSLFCPSSFPLLSLICPFSSRFVSSLVFPSPFPLLSLIFPSSVPHLSIFNRIRVSLHLRESGLSA